MFFFFSLFWIKYQKKMMKLKTKTGTIAEIGKIDKIDEKIIDKLKKIQVYNLL